MKHMTKEITNNRELDKYSLDFGSTDFYYGYLSNLDNQTISNIFGYLTKRGAANIACNIRKGKIKASRFKLMCNNLHKEPKEILSKYQPKVLQRFGNNTRVKGVSRLKEVEEPIRKAVYDAICDGK